MAGTDMPSTGQTDPQAQHVTLSPAGARQKALNALSFVLGMIVRNEPSASAALHITATVTGGVSILLGLYVQMISATRTERIVIVTGMIAGFVGASLGLAHGGF